MAVSHSFSQQVFAQLNLQPHPLPLGPPTLVYSHHGPAGSEMHRPPTAPACAPKPFHRMRSRAGSSSDASACFGSSRAPPPPLSAQVPRSTSRASFRSVSSIGSKLKLTLSNLRSSSHNAPPLPPALTWAGLREEYELHLARGSIIERCLVDVSIDPPDPALTRRWVDRVWRLADRLSPALPAALLHASADGLLPLLLPLRQSLDTLSELLPFKASRHHFPTLDATLSRASQFAKLIELVIETVGRAGLVRFELVGDPERWSGEIRGKTGSGATWKGSIRRSK